LTIVDVSSLNSSPRIHQATLQGATPAQNGSPGVLIFSDIDDTFVPWKRYNQVADVDKLTRTRKTLQDYEGDTVNGFCSARGLSSIQQMAHFFKGIPLQFIGTNGGQQVYINYEQRPAEEWLSSLKGCDSDPKWNQEVLQRSGGFNTQLVMRATHGVLREMGFQRCAVPLPYPHQDREAYVAPIPGKPGEVAVVALTKDQTTLMFRADFRDLNKPLTDSHRAFAKFLSNKLEQRLRGQGVKLTAKEFIDQASHQIYLLEPRNVSKESLLDHLIHRYPSVQAIITAGDNTNDTMLKPTAFGNVQNYRILSGDRPALTQMLAGQANVEHTDWGELAPALENHLAVLVPEEPNPPVQQAKDDHA
jgi:hydroxymethylpyrimidine pyrophosphatase-like HAD family hydrolase